MITTGNTRIYKSSNHGWMAETTEHRGGKDWQITTMKRYNGRITTNAQSGELNGSGGFSFQMFGGDKNITLISEKARATEKIIREQHAKALLLFDENPEVQEEEEKEVYTIKPGQIIYLQGYGQSKYSHDDLAIYEIEQGRFGTTYHTVNLKTLALGRHDRLTDEEEMRCQTIGIYYRKGQVISQDALNDAVITAKQKEAEENRREEANRVLQEATRRGKIEEGKELVNIPSWAKSVIVADLYQDDSDSMTDYFSTSKAKTVYLAFSRTERNSMAELKKAALNFEETKEFAPGGPELESTQYHSYLPSYFLGTERWYGWKVNKRKHFDLTKEENRNLLYIAAAEGRYFIGTQEEPTGPQQTEEVTGDISVISYSDKAIVVFGDTKPVKDTLKGLGGRFNFRLKHPKTGEKLAGWIFPKTKTEEVKQSLNL